MAIAEIALQWEQRQRRIHRRDVACGKLTQMRVGPAARKLPGATTADVSRLLRLFLKGFFVQISIMATVPAATVGATPSGRFAGLRLAPGAAMFATYYLRAAQAYMLISMPTGTSTIFGHFHAIRDPPKLRHDRHSSASPLNNRGKEFLPWRPIFCFRGSAYRRPEIASQPEY
jgi:hypothetical protein